MCSNVLVPPVSWSEVAVSRDDLLDRSEPLENHNTTDDHLTSVIALSFTRWQHQHTQYIPQVAAPLPNRPNHHIPPGFIDITKCYQFNKIRINHHMEGQFGSGAIFMSHVDVISLLNFSNILLICVQSYRFGANNTFNEKGHIPQYVHIVQHLYTV